MHVDMRRTGRHPENGIGDIIAFQRLESLINRFGPFFITPEADLAELGLDHAGIDRADPDGGIDQIDLHPLRDGIDSMFGSAINIALRVDLVSGNRADIDDMPLVAFDHQGDNHPADI